MKALYASLYFSFSLIIINSQYQGPPSFNRKKRHLLQGNKDQILRGAGKQYSGAGKFPISWGTSQIISGERGNREGLNIMLNRKQ